MKKISILMSLLLIFSSPIHATCEGGTEYTNNNVKFCVSNKTMNYWSAHAWCNANGMHLATWMEMCRMKSDESLNCYHRLANAAYPAGLADPVGTTLRAYIEVNGSYTYYKTADRVWTGSKALCAPNSQ